MEDSVGHFHFQAAGVSFLNGWHGIFVDYNGGSTATIADATAAIRIKIVDLSTGAVNSAGFHDWGEGITGAVGGDFGFGSTLNAKLASNVVTTLKQGHTVSDSEIQAMVMDPLFWILSLTQRERWEQRSIVCTQ